MNTKKTKKRQHTILGILSGIIAGAGIGYLFGSFGFDTGAGANHSVMVKLTLVPLAVFSILLVIAIHELGHLLAGWSQQFEFRYISVGPILFEKELDQLRFKWNKNFNTYGGFVICLPNDQVRLTKRFAVFTAGGPLASILYGLLLLLILRHSTINQEAVSGYFLHAFVLMNCVFTLCIGLLALIPMHTEGLTSDGGRLLNLLKGGPNAQIETTLLQYITLAAAGTRPALFAPEPLLQAIALPVESPMKPYLHSMLYSYYLDVKDLEKAAFHLDAYLQHAANVPKGYVATLYLEKAWFEARYHKNVALATEYFQKEKFGVMVAQAQVLRTEAAIAFAEGNKELAVAKAAAAIKELPKLIDKGAAIAEKEWLQEMLQEMELETQATNEQVVPESDRLLF